MSVPFSMQSATSGKRLDLVVGGELDGASAVALADELDAALAGGVVEVVIDCGALRFVDSKGIGALLQRRNQLADQGGSMTLSGTTGAVRASLDAMGLAGVLNLGPADGETTA